MIYYLWLTANKVRKEITMSEKKTAQQSQSLELSKDTLDAMIEQAKTAYNNAHAPYSKFHVGAASLSPSGEIYAGCNVENASYGLTVCAERNSVGHAVVSGEKKLLAIVIYTEEERLTPPCGACRQVISEFFAPSAPVIAANHLGEQKHWTVTELLPDAFTPEFLS